ncbi:HK97 family phage prohead protease [Nocardia aobensis]|uniref:HK97 family phage prohead protease n=1 Tax=Nocardia aobensis TaxID=257277 RepID=A0ABW6PEW5_9NOCA
MSEIHYRYSELGTAAGRTIHGLAVPFGEVTEVRDSYGPPYKETFVRGAFTRTIAERGNKLRLLAQHDGRSFPIGTPVSLAETDAGLAVAFRLSRTSAANDALELVRDGTVTGFSIGFVPIRDRVVDGVTQRLEVSLREVSLVAEPAYGGAQVAGIRSAQPSHNTSRVITAENAARRYAFLKLL